MAPHQSARRVAVLVVLVTAGALAMTACSSGDSVPESRKQRADAPGAGRSGERKTERAAEKKRREARRRKNLRIAAIGGDRDCGSFPDQASAQRAMAGGDPYGLDGDGDGVACVSLPCPCSKAASGGGGTGGQSGGAPGGSGAGRISPGSSFDARVVSVTDGDTIKVEAAGIGVETIRLIGIDTPEVYGGVECGGRAASNEMKRLATGKVTVRTDPTQDLRDRYGRLLAYIDRAGRDLGRTMVARGLAPSYVYDRKFRRYPAYIAAENRARAARRGSWRRCNIGE